ncbi:MAG: D-amino-acid transaminase [Nitrospirota bacterium]|nr:MAG: D-amino-acid transaminase [Nitrospirota bacterium]
MPDIGYLNGQFSPLSEISISPDDRGFLFGDGIYEVVRAYHGVPAFWEEHCTRLVRSAKEIQLSFSIKPQDFYRLLLTGLQQSGYTEGKIYIQITRGVAPREHGFPVNPEPTVFLSFREMGALPIELTRQGVKVITVPDIRWDRCDIKSLNLLPNVLAKQRAQEAKVFEAIFVRNGCVIEGATSNIFIVKDGQLRTPERNYFVLSGVTQQQIINLAQEQGQDVQFDRITLADLREADEVFLVGTTIEVIPVVNVDGQTIHKGIPGPVTCTLQQRFTDLVAHLTS